MSQEIDSNNADTNDKQVQEQKKKSNKETIYVKERIINNNEEKKKKIIKYVIMASIIIVVLIGIGIALYFKFGQPEDPINSDVIIDPPITPELKIATEFEFKNQVGDYKRIFVHQGYNETMVINGQKIDLFLERNTYYDIFILSETKPEKEHEKLYTTMYTASIAIGKECISSSQRVCEPIDETDPFFNADIEHLQLLSESDLKDAAFPLCIFNITDNDVITSIKCPESISDGKIKGIILDLYFFRPPAIQRPEKTTSNVTIIKEELENNKTFIRETNGGFCDIEYPFNSFCTTEMNTTKDAEGNLLTYDEIAFIEVKNDVLNSYKKNKLTNLIDITDKIGSFNKLEYKQKLDFLLSKFDPYMKYSELFTMEEFAELYDVSMGINRRRLTDSDNDNIKKTYIQGKTLFEYNDIGGAKLEFLLKADSGLNSETMKSHSDFKCDDNQTDIIHKDQPSDLTKILKNLIRLSQAGNHLATELSNNIKQYFENITNEISVKISSLNNLVVYKDLIEIFDSSLSLGNIQLLPKIIIEEINIIPRKLEEIIIKLKNGNIKSQISVLNSNIYDFIKVSHQLLRNIFSNLKNFVYSLKSDKSRFSEIAAHYLGRSTNLYMNVIEKSENILNNYYINEKKKIIPEVELILKNFEDSFNTTLKKAKNNLNSLYTRLINKTFEIEDVEEEKYENIISNVLNSINNLDIIMQKIKEYIKKEMDLKENGYFINQEDINTNKLSFIQVINEAKNIANKLDNDEFLDLKFDEIMTSFREVFIKIAEKMDDLRNEQFKLEENVLDSGLFDNIAREEIKTKFEVQPADIINFVIDQNDYINEFKQIIEEFKKNNELNSIIDNLNILFSNDTLEDLANLYDVGLSSSLEKIDKEIIENEFLAMEYMTNMSSVIKNNSFIYEKLKKYQIDEEHYPKYLYYWSDTHYVYRDGFTDTIQEKKITEGYQTKYNTFKANFAASENYIKDQLFLDLSSEYKNSLFQLRESLQSIRDNRKYFDKYPDYDFDFMDNHIDTVNNIYDRLNDFLSEDEYNNKYINKIQEYKKNKINLINSIEKKIENENENITKEAKTSSDYQNDFCVNFFRKKKYTCTNSVIYYRSYTDDYCCPLFIFSENHNKLKEISIKNDKNIIEYKEKYNEFYKIIKDTIDNYNSKINILKKQILDKEKEFFEKKINFTKFQKEIEDIISKLYGDKLIKASYDYYNNNIKNKVENIINQISNEWYKYFDELKESIKNNKNLFKNSIIELPLMASIYENVIYQNVTRDFYNSIITHQRNQFNYTILYYYNYLFKFINKTHHYIINQVPIGQKGLTLISDTRKQEINDYFNNLIKNISQLRDESLDIKKQLEVLQVEDNDFFNINSILNINIKDTKNKLNNKIDELMDMDNKKENDKFSLSLRYYLENNNNGDLITKFYKSINEGNFIDLKLDEFKNLIFNNWIYEPDAFKNNINKSISNSNLEIKKEFSLIKKNFTETLEAQIPLNLSLLNSVNYIRYLYKNEISSIDGTLKEYLVNNISEILNKVKENLYNESENFIYDTQSYKNNYTKINNTIKEIKEEIYNQTYLIIKRIIDDFHNNIINKIYNNYYNYHLNLFVDEVNNYRNLAKDYYKDYNLLNSSYNFGKTIDNIVEELINNYNNTIKITINDEYNKKLKKIIDWKEIKNLIDNEIDSEYENNLYSTLKKYATFESNNPSYIEYDLKEKIKKEIGVIINTTMKNNITNIANLIKGNNYSLDIYLEEFDFSQISLYILKGLEDCFIKFYNSQYKSEIDEINNLLKEIFKNNFNDLLNYLIPSFGNDFFERVFKYNQNFKIENLYNNLRYSLAHTLLYYLSLKELTEVKELPTDLKNKLFHINNLDLIVANKNDEILNLLDLKIEEFIEESKNEIISHYISLFDNETILITYFDSKIMNMIEGNLQSISYELEQIYYNFINKYLKEQYIISYTNKMNEKSTEMIKFVNSEKEKLRIKIYDLLTINPDKELNEINEKMKITENSLDNYVTHFNNSFYISDDLNNFLINYASSNIEPLFIKLIDIIHSATKFEVLDNLEKQSKIFEDNYDLKKFYNCSNNTLLYFKNNFIDNINKSLNDYGTNNYIENLESEINKYEERYRNRRALTEEDIKDKIADKQLDSTLRDLLTKSNSTQSFLNSLKQFNDFDNIITNNITKLKTEYKEAENILKNNNYDDDLYWTLHNKILNLKNIAEDYYLNINESYYNVKNYLFNSIYEVNNLLNECANITFNTFENKYDKIIREINTFHKNYTLTEEEKMKSIQNDYSGQHNGQIRYNTEIENSNKTTEFSLEYEYNNKKPILKAKIVNLLSPKKMNTKIISGTTDCGTTETDLDVQFGSSNITMVIYYDTNSTDVNVKTYTNFEKYTYNKIIYLLQNDVNSGSEVEAGGNSIDLNRFKNKKTKCSNINKIIQYQNSTTINKKEIINNENITLFN